MSVKTNVMILTGALLLGNVARVGADTFEIWKAGMTFEVQIQSTGTGGGPVLKKRKLKTNDVINLALGRSLATKPDAATEVLALAGDATTPGPGSKVVVFNPAAGTITTTVWTLNDFTLLMNDPDFAKTVAFANAVFEATAVGDAAHNGFSSTTVGVVGTGKHGDSGSLGVSAAFVGPAKFTVTDAANVTTTFDGVVLKGKFKTSGNSIGVVIE